ncbi:MAG: hypothetical protein JWP45_144 [Mucilaginibacter sp.]|nr:hypothetical protein [Mucilaginibacter sp.]
MSHRKQPERRTFLQDRLDILIKLQQSGKASFNELTELDEIVNSDPAIMKKIILENMLVENTDEFTDPSDTLHKKDEINVQTIVRPGLLNRITSLIKGIFTSQISAVKLKMLTQRMAFI